MRNTRWVLVANHEQARLLEHRVGKGLAELGHFVNPAGERNGNGMSTAAPYIPHATLPDAAFARQLAEALCTGQAQRQFDGVVLVAPLPFLESLCASIDAPLRECVVGKIGRDLTDMPVDALLALLPMGETASR